VIAVRLQAKKPRSCDRGFFVSVSRLEHSGCRAQSPPEHNSAGMIELEG
jgi:hypothetical protein